ncbi:hypothetical protein IP88_13655 [alpha proteobacterium AAP81b]|nr:hypothetical protein IP88_13655 [alpha proteobacterium AAP81b]
MKDVTVTADPIVDAVDTIIAGLEKMTSGFAKLRQHFVIPEDDSVEEFDPKDSLNKHDVGGLKKLTPRGVEICYRLFDQGLSRYAVSQAMDIAFGAASHRYKTWQKEGGPNRVKQPLN